MSQAIGYARVSPTNRLAPVIPIMGQTTAADALAALERHLGRCALADKSKRAYRRQARAYVDWLAQDPQPEAFVDDVGAEAAVTAWRRYLLGDARLAPSSVNQALAAVVLMYEQTRIRIKVKRARVPKPGEPAALARLEESRLRKAADRRCARDSAIVALLLGTGARVSECAGLGLEDVTITARTGEVRLFGKGDEVRFVPLPEGRARDKVKDWLLVHPGGSRLWTGQRGPLTAKGITKLIGVVGAQAGLEGLHPHQLRHTYATRLREGGADPAQIQALMGHASIETTARYFRASAAEVAALVDRVLDY